MSATEPIRDKKQLKELADYWLKRGNVRNYTLIVLGVCTALRISDLLRLTWNDVHDGTNFRTHITLTESKTKKTKTLALSRQAVNTLRTYYAHRHGAFIFASNRRNEKAISRVQAWRIIKAAAEALRSASRIACHSLRKTFGYHAWMSGASPVVLMDIFNHSSYDVTRRYLGVSQDDRDRVYLKLELF